jgi:hypothetical protein
MYLRIYYKKIDPLGMQDMWIYSHNTIFHPIQNFQLSDR